MSSNPRLKWLLEQIEVLATAVEQNPSNSEAKRWLAKHLQTYFFELTGEELTPQQESRQMKHQTAHQIAQELSTYLPIACVEAADASLAPNSGYLTLWNIKSGGNWLKTSQRKERADALYNDAEFLEDVLGGHLYGLTQGDTALRHQVLDLLDSKAHTALKQAIAALRKDL